MTRHGDGAANELGEVRRRRNSCRCGDDCARAGEAATTMLGEVRRRRLGSGRCGGDLARRCGVSNRYVDNCLRYLGVIIR